MATDILTEQQKLGMRTIALQTYTAVVGALPAKQFANQREAFVQGFLTCARIYQAGIDAKSKT